LLNFFKKVSIKKKKEIIKLENEIVISEIVFGMVHG
jgi:putative transposon-encoded protein